MAAVAPYQFKPDSCVLTEQPDGRWIADFELSTYQDQTFKYSDNGINAENYREIIVTIEGDEKQPVSYRPGQTPPFARTTEIGVELVAEKDGHKEDGISTGFS